MGAGGSKKGKKVGLKCLKMDFKDMVFFVNMDFDPFLKHTPTQIWTNLYF